jgi:hypothetical protein
MGLPPSKIATALFQQLRLPLRHAVGMDVELFGKLGDRAIAFECRERHFRLEGACAVAARTSGHELLLFEGFFALGEAESSIG